MNSPPTSRCPGCGAVLEALVGPTHAYIESSPACWATYGQILAREYSDSAYMQVHRLTVDAYAAQHPGQPSRRSVQSVAGHLIALHAVLELGTSMPAATRMLGQAIAGGGFAWLEPPDLSRTLKVVDVVSAKSAAVHQGLVWEWAGTVWTAWREHHPRVREWARRAIV